MLLRREVPAARPPPGVIPNFVNPVSLRPTTIAVGVILQTAAFVLVLLRLIANSSGGRKIWWNDYLCILALIFSTGGTAVILSISKLARHQYDIPLRWYDASYFKSVYALTILVTLAIFFAKNTMFLLYLRVFNLSTGMKRLRQAIIAGMVFTVPVYGIPIVLESYYCAPHAGSDIWNLKLAMNCSHSSLYGVILGVINVLLDLYIIGLPIAPILQLHLSMRKRLGILSIFATGLFALIASTIAMVFRARFHFNIRDVSWQTAGLLICLMVETNVIIICSCMPALAALSKTRFADLPLFRSLRSLLLSRTEKYFSSEEAKGDGRRLWPVSKKVDNNRGYPYSESDVQLTAGRGITKAVKSKQSSLSGRPSLEVA